MVYGAVCLNTGHCTTYIRYVVQGADLQEQLCCLCSVSIWCTYLYGQMVQNATHNHNADYVILLSDGL